MDPSETEEEKTAETACELVERLRDPRCYTHAVRQVEVKETHISWVLLTGDYAYKIKKPVKLPFLDFSTLQRRLFFCEEELRLNRRFAPEIYLAVVPVTGTPDSPRIGESGEAIEYAVRLKQFASQEELGALLERGAATADDLSGMGRRIAEMHAVACTSNDFASANQTWATVTANTSELFRLVDDKQQSLSGIENWLKRNWTDLSEVMDERCRSHKVRECHGDLHVGNVVRLNDVLLPFDCIEFDAALRYIDVVNDVAFLAMDLMARSEPSLAYAFLNGWLEQGGDYAGIVLLRFFQVYRAMVRAKVSALRDDKLQTSWYLDCAKNLCGNRQPRLILTCGLSGSGKTWLSTRLMTDLQAIRLRSDVERKRMVGLKADASSRSSRGEGIYTLAANQRVYSCLLAGAREVLRAGEHCIVDAAFLKRDERRSFAELAGELKIPITILYCHAPMTVLRTRLTQRQAEGRDASEADISVMERQTDYWEPFDDIEKERVLEIDTAASDPVAFARAHLEADSQKVASR